MKKSLKPILTFLFMILYFPLIAQDLEARVGETQKTNNGAKNYEIIEYIDNKLLVLNKSNTGFFNDNYEIEYLLFDKNLNSTTNIELKIPKNKYSTKVDYLNVFRSNNKLSLITSYVNSSKKYCYFFSNTINSNGIVEADFKKVNEYTTPSNNYGVRLSFSPDSSKILIFTWDTMKSFKEKKIDCCVLDKNFNQLWKKEFIMPIKEDDFDAKKYMINNEGKAFIVGYSENNSKEKNSPKLLISVIVFEASKDNASVITINEMDELKDYLIKLNPDNNLQLLALVSKNKKGKTSHIKNIIIDSKTNNISYNSTIEIPSYFFDVMENKKAENIGIGKFDLCNLLYKPDGGYYILAEQRSFTESMGGYVGPYGGGNTIPTFTNNYTYIFNLDKSHTSIWAVQIPKIQKSTNDQGRYNSFYCFLRNGNIYSIHNENKKNQLDTNPTAEKAALRKTTDARLVLTEIKPDGSISQKFIANNNNQNIVFLPSTAKLINNKLLIFGEKMIEGTPFSKFKESTLGEIDLLGN